MGTVGDHGCMGFTVQAADHTGITVTDVERSLAFWQEVLGFELSHRAQLSGEFAAGVTGVPGAEMSIAVVIAPGGHRPRPCDVGSVHVDDIDAVLAAAADAEWRPSGTRQTMASGPRAGTRFAYMHDPIDGTIIELIQAA